MSPEELGFGKKPRWSVHRGGPRCRIASPHHHWGACERVKRGGLPRHVLTRGELKKHDRQAHPFTREAGRDTCTRVGQDSGRRHRAGSATLAVVSERAAQVERRGDAGAGGGRWVMSKSLTLRLRQFRSASASSTEGHDGGPGRMPPVLTL
ncbi:hypothetical protein LX36DRAFT_239920 [Colletotrichum falcatum]|nr:hypothetical protein LX36DRAFT_239920 [Colletotrichum falcatum]